MRTAKQTIFTITLVLSSAAAAPGQYDTAAPAKTKPTAASAPVCPWLTLGSAARVLGGDAVAMTKVSESGGGTCRFSRQPEGRDWLEISVSKAVLPACPAKSIALTGIGNRAERCKGGEHADAEMISGRVRDLFFTVKLTSGGQKGSAKLVDPQDDALEQIAEQVAGSLY